MITASQFNQAVHSLGTGAASVAATAQTSEAVAAAIAAGVSPESLLAIVGTRLREMDSQIATSIAELNNRSSAAKGVSDQLKALYKLKAHAEKSYSKDSVTVDAGKGRRESDLIEDDGELISVAKFIDKHELEGLLSTFEDYASCKNGSGMKDTFTFIKTSTIASVIETKKQELTDINSGNELSMIALQSQMQQRTQVITLGTNLMKQLHEASESVIRNIV